MTADGRRAPGPELLLPPQTPALGRLGEPAVPARTQPSASPVPARDGDPGLVSCIMPTCDRPAFARNAVRLFEAQDYPDRELIVVDDRGRGQLEQTLPPNPRIRYIHAPPGESIGAKRNRACAAASGEYIAHWDDDDWYGTGRLTAQLEPLIAGRADITGLVTPLIFDLPSWRFWTVTPKLHRTLFVDDVHGGTLVFRRSVWERLARYPDVSLAEDAGFLGASRRRGARLLRVPGDGLFIYVRHGRNAWSFTCGEYMDPAGWRSAGEPPLSLEDHAFYRARHKPAAGASRRPRAPLVTCIMPTKDRRAFVTRAIAYFERQDYENRELLVLDDGDDPVEDIVPEGPRVRYVRIEPPIALGEKRNRACELARGSIVAHWDDDDWYPAHRIRFQVEELSRHDAEVCGPARVLFVEPARRRAWLYEDPTGAPVPWISGSGLCYRLDAWAARPFESIAAGEDTRFVRCRQPGAVVAHGDHRLLVARIHEGNSSAKVTSTLGWRPHAFSEVRTLLGDDYGAYEAAA